MKIFVDIDGLEWKEIENESKLFLCIMPEVILHRKTIERNWGPLTEKQ